MRLDKLVVHRLPGLPREFEVETSGQVTVVLGPNGSGKSSLNRAVRSLLWAGAPTPSPFFVEGHFTWDGVSWKAIREEGLPTRWLRDGETCEAPVLPAEHVARCYELGVLDLVLPAGGEVELKLAEVINNEMSGGVNLDQVADELFPEKSKTPAKRRLTWQEAKAGLNNLLREQRHLADREKELGNLKEQLASTEDAAAVLGLMEKLRDRHQAADKLQQAQAHLQSFAPGQNQVRPDDLQTLKQLQDKAAQTHQQLLAVDSALDHRQEKLDTLALDPAAPDPELLERLVQECETAQAELKRSEVELARQQANLKQVLRELDPQTEAATDGPQPGGEAFSDLARAYSKIARQQAEVEGLAGLLDLPELAASPESENHRAAVARLKAWSEAAPPPAQVPWISLVSSLTTVATGLYLALNGTVAGWAAGALGLGLLVVAGSRFVLLRRDQQRHLKEGQDLFWQVKSEASSGHGAPTGQEIIRLLEEETTASLADGIRKSLNVDLERKLQVRKINAATVTDEARQLRLDHGLALDPTTPDLLHLLNAIPRFRTARANVTTEEASVRYHTEGLAHSLSVLGSKLQAVGLARPTTVAEGRLGLEKLQVRLGEIRDLQRELDQDRKDKDRLQGEQKEGADQIAKFWLRLGLAGQQDERLIEKLVENLPAWQKAQNDLTQFKREFETLNTGVLAWRGPLDLGEAEALSPDHLVRRIEGLQEEIQTRDGLLKDINLIEFQVREARGSLQVAEARNRVEMARSAWEESRRDERNAAVGKLLLQEVAQSYHRASQPGVLARAADNFRDFTRGRYDLRVQPGPQKKGTFRAHDTQSAENLKLAELSDGTRAQLLLAVRLAFIAENEDRLHPPLFLDESLTSSDPDRFAAVASNLARWAQKQERQVFYLSSNPADLAAWESALAGAKLPAPRSFDLARARNLAAGIVEAPAAVPPSPPVKPDGMDALQYAQALGVPRLDGWHPHTETHLWHLLQDDLPLLYRLELAAAPTLGRWLARRQDMETLAGMDAAAQARLQARGHLLDVFLKQWRIGKGRPVTGFHLEQSGLVTEKFSQKCLNLLVEVEGNAPKFLAGLRNKKVPRFQSRNIDGLEAWFIREGLIDQRPVVKMQDILGYVQSALIPQVKADHITVAEIRSLVLTWNQALT